MSSAAWVKALLPAFQKTGLALASHGLITGSSGNLSVRFYDRLVVTRHDSSLSALTLGDLIETGIRIDDAQTPLASCELPVHRAIYLATEARAIVHAHPPHAIALSNVSKETLADAPLIGSLREVVPGALADEIASALKSHALVMVRGHGSFAVGKTLDEALAVTRKFEQECGRGKKY